MQTQTQPIDLSKFADVDNQKEERLAFLLMAIPDGAWPHPEEFDEADHRVQAMGRGRRLNLNTMFFLGPPNFVGTMPVRREVPVQ